MPAMWHNGISAKRRYVMSKYIEIEAAIDTVCDAVELYPSEYARIADALRNLPVDATWKLFIAKLV